MTTDVIIEPDIEGSERSILRQYLPEAPYAVVYDHNTYEALAKRLLEALDPADVIEVDLGAHPYASLECVDKIREASQSARSIVAVGSGTINDLCKYAAHQEGKPYAVFASAPSMNGYVSANASLAFDGIRHSLMATPPQAVICDLEVLANAPMDMILSGLGDSICRPTAQADWLMSHLLLDTDYDETPFNWLMEFEDELFENADMLQQRDQRAIYQLTQTLIASGRGMLHVGGSMPASQGEHMIIHTIESLFKDDLVDRLHGEAIGVATLTMSRLQTKILEADEPPHLVMPDIPEMWQPMWVKKIPDTATIDRLNARIQDQWDQMRSQIHAITRSTQYIETTLNRAGAKTTLYDLEWKQDQYLQAIRLAPFTRERFTFLDIAAMSDQLP